MSRFALEGVHILDFAWVGVGPITTKYFADNGADVIRVESAARLDVLRIGPPWKDAMPGINRSQFFASFNTSKKGITLDLSKPKARDIAKRLVPWADIIVESFTPKAMRNWGLDYENLRELRPDLIMLSTCMQGQTGPNAIYPGFGTVDGRAVGLLLHLGLRPADRARRRTARIPISSRRDSPRSRCSPRSTIAAAPARVSTSTCRSTRLRCRISRPR